MWKKIEIIFTIKSPLHIGYLPSKNSVISPTRYYILGKNFWGAITKNLTEYLFDFPNGNDYIRIGKQIKDNFRFSNFFLYDGRITYTPKFTSKGLLYGSIKDIEFEHKFISSRISTAIDKLKGIAKDKSLHEIEFIKNVYQDSKKKKRILKLRGKVWIKDNFSVLIEKKNMRENKGIDINRQGIFLDDNFNFFENLILGGEKNYGFGLIKLDSITSIKSLDRTNEINIKIKKNEFIPFHIEYHPEIEFQGDIELIGGRNYVDIEDKKDLLINYNRKPGKVISNAKYYIIPGSFLTNTKDCEFILQWNGVLKKIS